MSDSTRDDEIRWRAHQIWMDRTAKGIPGTPESDWKAAEAELDKQQQGNTGNSYTKTGDKE
jgi:hypothetical protein